MNGFGVQYGIVLKIVDTEYLACVDLSFGTLKNVFLTKREISNDQRFQGG